MKTMLKNVVDSNCDQISKIYKSDFFNALSKDTCFQSISLKAKINDIYRDPDTCDEKLKAKAKKYEDLIKNEENPESTIELNPDGICGWKILFDVYKGNENDEWINKYRTIRTSTIGTLFWPAHAERNQTINIQRSRCFGDRIDLTLFDIKQYIENKKYVMTYKGDNAKLFDYYKEKENGFSEFIHDFSLEVFVKFDKDDCNVYDLSQKNYDNKGTEPINEEKVANFSWSNGMKAEKKRERLSNYLDNLVEMCEKNPGEI